MRTYNFILVILVLTISFYSCTPNKSSDEKVLPEITNSYWWPKQPIPKGIIRGVSGTSHGEKALLYSLSGIVAEAQKDDRVDELIWIESSGEYLKWYSKVMDRLKAEDRGRENVWGLLGRYSELGLINGYILYKSIDDSDSITPIDYSYNIAVSYAGVKQAVIVEESLEKKMIELGLKKILDARNITPEESFKDLREVLNNNLLVTMHPNYHNNSDFAIANKAMQIYGNDETVESIMAWMEPISPIIGWNKGDEIDFTSLPTKYGHFNTASDWCKNLIVLSSGSERANPEKIHSLDPKTIKFEEGNHFNSFVMSDGDNMQWTIGNFIDNENYWGSALHGDFPIGFTSCPSNLLMMAPDVLDEMAKTQPAHTTIIEYGGGYQYPDLFASQKPENREEIQRVFARKIGLNMKIAGTKVFGFICVDVDSPEALEAYKIYAEEIDDLVGMMAVQYSPYHGGEGKTYWVKNRSGIEIPVMTAKFALWDGMDMAGGGGVSKVAESINSLVERKNRSLSWTSVHAWSRFENPLNPGAFATGLEPISWCIDLLDQQISIVSPEELLWRMRWEHDKDQTVNAIKNFKD